MNLATRRTTSTTGLATLPQVNLLPVEIAERRQLRVVQAGLGGGVALALALVVALYFLAAASVSSAQGDLVSATAAHDSTQKQLDGYQNVGQTYALVDQAHTLLRTAGSSEVQWSHYLTDLSLRIPSTVWLSQVTVGPAAAAAPAGPAVVGAVPAVATITFTGIALSHDDVALWLDSLAKEKGWSDPYFSTSVEQYIGSHQTYTFTSSVTVTAAALSGRYAIPARS